MELAIIWIICGIIGAIIGSRKGSGCAGVALGFLLGPLGIIIVLVMRGNRKACPHCKELIHSEATTCKHCGKDLRPGAASRSSAPTCYNVLDRPTGTDTACAAGPNEQRACERSRSPRHQPRRDDNQFPVGVESIVSDKRSNNRR